MSKLRIVGLISIFFLVTILHFCYAPLENWPFSSFGMYKSLRTDSNVISLDLYRMDKGKKEYIFLLLGDYRFYLEKGLEKIVNIYFKYDHMSSEVLFEREIREYIKLHVDPALKSHNKLFIEFRVWKSFSNQKINYPDYKRTLEIN
jgi:hypothetical protein